VDEDVEVGEDSGAKLAVPGRRGSLEHVYGLTRAIVERSGHAVPNRFPQLRDGALLTDQHARVAARGCVGKGGDARPGRDDVRADVAKRREVTILLASHEASQTASCHVLEEDPLDGLLGAESKDVPEGGALEDAGHARTITPF
jgi:hypothetical protein